jgi:Domain of unknown function (DUF1906)
MRRAVTAAVTAVLAMSIGAVLAMSIGAVYPPDMPTPVTARAPGAAAHAGAAAAHVQRIIQSVHAAPDPPRAPTAKPVRAASRATLTAAVVSAPRRHTRPAVRRHSRPAARGHARPAARRHTRPAAHRHSRPAVRRHARPAVRRHARPAAHRHSRPAARGHARPAARGHARPAVGHRTRPAVRGRSNGAAYFPSRPVEGIDTCRTPSASAMRAWRKRASVMAVYIGGADRACGNGNLSASWVSQVRAEGWHLIPTYVGLQASCEAFGGRIDPRRASSEGRAAADDAITQAGELRIGRGAPLYYDMEEYSTQNSACRTGVLTFLDTWTRELHARGYLSGVYTSARPGGHDIANAGSVGGHSMAKPDSIWIGFWDGRDNLSAAPYVPGSAWSGRRRIKQYRGSHWETVGKARLNVDSDRVYGPVYLWPAHASARYGHSAR